MHFEEGDFLNVKSILTQEEKKPSQEISYKQLLVRL